MLFILAKHKDWEHGKTASLADYQHKKKSQINMLYLVCLISLRNNYLISGQEKVILPKTLDYFLFTLVLM